ncbi:probable protein arginine N-methyltransferase 1 [Vitis vinifera]|uniref:probable protein arginine N-methyltransferase 1 n=1 Tax=Vitis vinifera TaxID=29760 RepID=UPI00053F503E|nr:probable protein arginine N-methyltransferase 1 [Vitis vinifera]|eukprot:XP_010661467.1 PREDICTED: probable protein arginine N-methyltransferase 1 [Vitis vinifera]
MAEDAVDAVDAATKSGKTEFDSEYKEDKVKFLNSVYDFDMSCIERQVMMKPLVDRVDQNQTVTNCRLLERMGISEMTLIEMVWTNLQLAIIGCLSFSIMEFCNNNDIQLSSHGHLTTLLMHFFYPYVNLF